MSDEPRDVLNFTKKQRLELIANLIIDKIEEDIAQGQPLLKRIEAENLIKDPSKQTEYQTVLERKLDAWVESRKRKKSK